MSANKCNRYYLNIPWKYTMTFFTLLLPNQCACAPLGNVMLSGVKPLSFANWWYMGVVAPFMYRSCARSRLPSWVRNMANMTSLKYVLEPLDPLKGEVTRRPDAEPTATASVYAHAEDQRTIHTSLQDRRRDAQLAHVLVCHTS